MLETFGTTSDMIVAALLAVGQLITPVPETGVHKGEQLVAQRASCQSFAAKKSEFAAKNCIALKKDRRAFKEECQSLEVDMQTAEVQCATDPEVPQILRYKPRPLADYAKLSNQELTQELHTICYAIQDRVFLDPEQWMSGMVADRDSLGEKLKTLQDKDGALQKSF